MSSNDGDRVLSTKGLIRGYEDRASQYTGPCTSRSKLHRLLSMSTMCTHSVPYFLPRLIRDTRLALRADCLYELGSL